VVVVGDRIEAFAAATAASIGHRVLAHIHGGDRAVGTTDDMLRNAITRLAHVHLVASRDAEDRLKRMGEVPRRIHRVGAPGLDDIRRFQQKRRRNRRAANERLQAIVGNLRDRSYAMVAQHPMARPARTEYQVMQHVVKAVERCGLGGVVVYPNSDPGHDGIIKLIQTRQGRPNWRVFHSLERDDFFHVVAGSAVMVGNSSSGIIESASLGVNAVNIGRRQSGRLRCGEGVFDVNESADSIIRALRRAVRRPRPVSARSVYGDGRSAERIARILERLIIKPSLLQKELTY